MIIVLKVGGELMTEGQAAERAAMAASVRALLDAGQRVVVVHGGGPQTSALQRALGQTPNVVSGRRVTDEAALEAIKMVVGGQVNIDLVSALRGAGVPAVGLNGVSGQAIACERRPPTVVPGAGPEPIDYGLVGRITGVARSLFELLIGAGYVPVLACIGSDDAGRPYNINADDVACAVVGALEAETLVMLTATPGVLEDKDDPSTRVPRMTIADAKAAIADGTVQGGMIPKVQSAIGALEAGAQRVLIVGQLAAGALERALAEPGGVGTVLCR